WGDEDINAVRFCAYGLVGSVGDVGVSVHPTGRKTGAAAAAAAAAATAAAAARAASVGAAAAGVSTQLQLLQRLQQWGFDVLLERCVVVNNKEEAIGVYDEHTRAHNIYTSHLQDILREDAAAAAAA